MGGIPWDKSGGTVLTGCIRRYCGIPVR